MGTEKEEKPPLDLFAAIFNDSDSDDDDDDVSSITGQEDANDLPSSNADVKDEPLEETVANENQKVNKDSRDCFSAEKSSVSAVTLDNIDDKSSESKSGFLPLSFLNQKRDSVMHQQIEGRSRFSCVPLHHSKEPLAGNESEVAGPALPIVQANHIASERTHGSKQKSHLSKHSSDSDDEWTEQSKERKSKKKKKKKKHKQKQKYASSSESEEEPTHRKEKKRRDRNEKDSKEGKRMKEEQDLNRLLLQKLKSAEGSARRPTAADFM